MKSPCLGNLVYSHKKTEYSPIWEFLCFDLVSRHQSIGTNNPGDENHLEASWGYL